MMSFKKYKEKWEEKEKELAKDIEILRKGHKSNWDKVEEDAKARSGETDSEVEAMSKEEQKKVLKQSENIKRIEEALPKGEAMGLDYDEPEQRTEEEDRAILREGHQTNFDLVESRTGAGELEADRQLKEDTKKSQILEDKRILGQPVKEKKEDLPLKEIFWTESKSCGIDSFNDEEILEGIGEPFKFRGSIIKSGERTQDGHRFYRDSAVKAAYKDAKNRLEEDPDALPITVAVGHPKKDETSPERIVGKVEELNLTDEGEIQFGASLCNSSRGLDAQEAVRNGLWKSLSLRADGKQSRAGSEINMVDEFRILGIDFVAEGGSSARVL